MTVLRRRSQRRRRGADSLSFAADHAHGVIARRCSLFHGQQAVGLDGLGFPLQLERRKPLDGDALANEVQCLAAEQNLAGVRGLLQPGRNVDGVSSCEALLGSGNDLAGVDPDPQLELRFVVALQLTVQVIELRAEILRGADSAQCVVLVHLRHAEDGHHGVADELLDHSAVALDCGAGDVEVAGEHAAEALRIETLAECGRARDVAEQDGDRLPLLVDGLRLERRSARVAEPRSHRVLVTALRADHHR